MLKILKSLAIASLFCAATSQALPIIEADAFSTGDNKAVKDTTTGLVWLDFGTNNSKSFNQVVNELDSTYKGWRLPTETEVFDLFHTLFASIPGYNESEPWMSAWGHLETTPVNEEFSKIFDIFGVNHSLFPAEPYNWGWFKDSQDHLQTLIFYIYKEPISSDYPIGVAINCCTINGWNYDAHMNDINSGTSTLLVRSSVSESSSILLIGLSLMCLLFARIRKANK